jgi:hypothetical protein
MILFLDDCPARCRWAHENLNGDEMLMLAFNAETAIGVMEKCKDISTAFLNHDPGGTAYQPHWEKNSGSEVVRWVMKNKPSVGRFVVHSMDTPAANRMVSALQRAGYDACYVPFIVLISRPDVYAPKKETA